MAYSTSCPPSTRKFRYYDLRQADRPVDAFSDQVATISRQDVSHQTLLDKAAAQGFRLDQ